MLGISPPGQLSEIGFVLHISPSAAPRQQAKLGLFCTLGPAATPYSIRNPQSEIRNLAALGPVPPGTAGKLGLFVQRSSSRQLTTDYRLLPFGFVSHESPPPRRREPAPDLSGGGGGTRSQSQTISRHELGILFAISVSLWGRGDACVARTGASRRWTKIGALLVKTAPQSS
jgi:hypothetical protein